MIDSGAPDTVIGRVILESLGLGPTGEYFVGLIRDVSVPECNFSTYVVGLEKDVSLRGNMKIYSINPSVEARVLLGMDWLRAHNPKVDWQAGTLSPKSGLAQTLNTIMTMET
ncbi:hypothetical protein EG329_010022 [Mollisiaceae sp. DMI_Dod_QoI]|nr:hypothetical protein EG329_010022 [Helotiales sp. DMI_Dod_QoI]